MRFVDTHCHLDAGEFGADRDEVARAALCAGVALVLPAIDRHNFATVRDLASRHPGCVHALGIHPLRVDGAGEEDLELLRRAIAADDPVAVGEIGLDHFVDGADRERQEWLFVEQLKIAREAGLPVLLHVRRAQDQVLKQLRRIDVPGGIAHAFNGSWQQAQEFVKLGFALGFGGAMTYPRALRIRDLAAKLPDHALVLETDAPDIPPAWIRGQRNAPVQLPRIAVVLAELRGCSVEELAGITTENAFRVLPRLAGRLSGVRSQRSRTGAD